MNCLFFTTIQINLTLVLVGRMPLARFWSQVMSTAGCTDSLQGTRLRHHCRLSHGVHEETVAAQYRSRSEAKKELKKLTLRPLLLLSFAFVSHSTCSLTECETGELRREREREGGAATLSSSSAPSFGRIC